MHFERRGFSGDEAEPMLCALDEDEHGKAAWTWRKLELATFDKVVSLANEGYAYRDFRSNWRSTNRT